MELLQGKCQQKSSRCDPEGLRTLMQYLNLGLYPVYAAVHQTARNNPCIASQSELTCSK